MPPTMAATVPAELRTVFDRFYTTEHVTVDGHGQPIAWPVTPYVAVLSENFQKVMRYRKIAKHELAKRSGA